VSSSDHPDRAWLRTPEGRAWLESDDGVAWINTRAGLDWSESADGREWMESLADRGYDDYIADRSPAPPDWAMTPETAPRVGTRVRVARAETTLAGVDFKEGELGIVIETRLAPIGCVFITVRMLDGRRLLTGHPETVAPA
jgi:hypothetical protein